MAPGANILKGPGPDNASCKPATSMAFSNVLKHPALFKVSNIVACNAVEDVVDVERSNDRGIDPFNAVATAASNTKMAANRNMVSNVDYKCGS